MKRQHLWGIVENGELTPDTFTTQQEAREDIRMHKECGIYGPRTKVVKLVIDNGPCCKTRKCKNKPKKSRATARARKN